ncbi:MAG: ABC transporter ATP-binding protein [Symbiobacteriaceae bacterium]|nr:ABC transporter ATP-binding protein [Symbiobacteriaceae bacterium]
MATLLTVEDLKVTFSTKFGQVNAVNNISFTMNEGEILAVVGESGSGKSVTALSILQLLAKNGRIRNGVVSFGDHNLVTMPEGEMRKVRGAEISMIFQDPMSCLNPVFTVEYQMEEVLRFHKKEMSREQRHSRMIEMLELVQISNPEQRLKQYPHELSGGMRQRVMIAISLLCQPKLLIADEPTTALDVTIQAQIVNLIKELSRQLHTSVMLITHNLGMVAGMADRVQVMYGGEIVETAPIDVIFYGSRHPYTSGLLKALPKPNMGDEPLHPIPGSTPDLLLDHIGCMFYERCDYAMECCRDLTPPKYRISSDHMAKCWRCHPDFSETAEEKEVREAR